MVIAAQRRLAFRLFNVRSSMRDGVSHENRLLEGGAYLLGQLAINAVEVVKDFAFNGD